MACLLSRARQLQLHFVWAGASRHLNAPSLHALALPLLSQLGKLRQPACCSNGTDASCRVPMHPACFSLSNCRWATSGRSPPPPAPHMLRTSFSYFRGTLPACKLSERT